MTYAGATEAETEPRKPKRLLAGCLTFLIGIVAYGFWWASLGSESQKLTEERFAAALVEEIIPTNAIQLRGDILIRGFRIDRVPDETVEQARGNMRVFRAVCDAVCAALLALPEVESVTVIVENRSDPLTRFRMVDRSECTDSIITPFQPDNLRSVLGAEPEQEMEQLDHSERLQAGLVTSGRLEIAWRIRLSTEDCIVVDREQTAADFIIERTYETLPEGYVDPQLWKWTFDQRPIIDRQLKILAGDGTTLFRRQFAEVPVLARPIRPGTVANCGDLCFEFGWYRSRLANHEADESKTDNELLLEHTNLSLGVRLSALPYNGQNSAIADVLRIVISDSERPASDPAFGLIDLWMRSLNTSNITDEDVALLAMLIEDQRVTTFQAMWHINDVLGDRIAELQEPIRRRIASDPQRGEVVGPLSAQLIDIVELESASDAGGGPNESDLAILNDPEARLHAQGLIISLSAYGEQSVPLLTRIMQEHMERTRDARAENPGQRIPSEIVPIDAAMVALCRLGPKARSAIPGVLALRESWLGPTFRDERRWHFALARIGVPLHEIPKPRGLTRITQDEYESRLLAQLQRSNPEEQCQTTWV